MNPLALIITGIRIRYLIRFANRLCKMHKIVFPYTLTVRDADVIRDIFFKRVYASGFPFYQNCTIIDIGAHKGYFSLFASKNAGPKAIIYSIEPEPSNFNSLIQNIKANSVNNISAHQGAISGTTGKQTLYLSDSVNHSLLKVKENHPYIKQEKSIKVEVFSLKDFLYNNSISEVEFLKIDCEGGEYDILFNTDDQTLSRIKTIALEFHDLNNSDKNIYTLSRFLFSKGFKHISIEFQDTIMPLNMGIMILSK